MDIEILPKSVVNSSRNVQETITKKRLQQRQQLGHPDQVSSDDLIHLAHYATAEGLYGIIKNGCLWASAAYYLNDSSEIDYGCKLFTNFLAEFPLEPEKEWLRTGVLEKTEKAFKPGGFMDSVIPRTYVACFCEDENLLSQWRAYGQGGGYSISFRRKELVSSLKVEDELYLVELRRVIYDEKVQIEQLRGVLSDVLSALDDPSVLASFQNIEDEYKPLFFTSFEMFLQTLALGEIVRFKYPAFKDEKEWRLVIRPQSPFLNSGEIGQLKFRPARGMVIPYLELRPKLKAGRLPIDFVRYGPTLEKKRVENSLDLLFKQNGYGDVTFRGSEIPVIFP
jgi:hypothetical protein